MCAVDSGECPELSGYLHCESETLLVVDGGRCTELNVSYTRLCGGHTRTVSLNVECIPIAMSPSLNEGDLSPVMAYMSD